MSDLRCTASSLEIEKRWVVEAELDIDENVSCETDAATVLASNKRAIATVSPEKMQEEGSDQENLSLCRLVATLLWLVSVWTPPERGASNRRAVMRMFHSMLQCGFLNTQFYREDIYELLRQYGNPPQIYMTGTFVTQLLTTLNAQDDRTGAYHQRDRLLRLILDILANPPSMVTPPINEEELSTLTCHHDGITAVNPPVLARAIPDVGRMNVEGAAMPHAAVNDDSFAGGLAISEDTPQDGARPEDIIVAEFRAGNYSQLEQAYQSGAVITALSSSLAVMSSLLANPAGGVAASSLEAQEGGEDEEGKEEKEDEDTEEADNGAP